MENHAVCTEFVPNQRIAWQTTSARLPFHVVVDFTPVDGGTRVDWMWELNPTGAMRLLAGPMMALTRRMFQSDLENLKKLMESGRITAERSPAG
jgi:hypothetical protein